MPSALYLAFGKHELLAVNAVSDGRISLTEL